MAGSLLCSQPCRLRNIPDLVDVSRMGEVLKALGVKLRRDGNVLELDPSDISHTRAPYELVSKL